MRNHRMAVGNSLKGKIGELGFFLFEIAHVSNIIEEKHIKQDYPLNNDIDALNYFFSAFLNSIQSIKDACQESMAIKVSWKNLSPNYGAFIYYCRNATTHDGTHMINAGKGVKNYIIGPLQRIDHHGNTIEFDPPKEDVLALCCKMSSDIMSNLKGIVLKYGENILAPDENDFKKDIEVAIKHNFIPDFVKDMIKASKSDINSSFKIPKINRVKEICDIIESVENKIKAMESFT